MKIKNDINHNITFFIDNDGSVTLSDFPLEFSELVIKLSKKSVGNGKK